MIPITREIRTPRRSLGTLDRSLRRPDAMLGQLDGQVERQRRPRGGSRRPLSAMARASLAKGVRAAIERARELAGR